MYFLNIASLLIIFYIGLSQYKERSAALVFTVLLFFYILLPQLIPINIYFVRDETLIVSSMITFTFCVGYLASKFIPIGMPVDYLSGISSLINKTKFIYFYLFIVISLYIVLSVLFSDFNREILSSYLNNRVQVIHVLFLAILLWSEKKSYNLYVIYSLTILVVFFLFLSGSRIYIAPSLLMIIIFKYSKSDNNSGLVPLVLLTFLITLSVSLFRNYEGDLFSLRSLVGLVGEFYFTFLSFLTVIDNNIFYPHKFYEAILAFLLPSFSEDISLNSDKYVNQFSTVDFGLASSFFNDIALYQQQFTYPYFFLGLFIGLFYNFISKKLIGLSFVISLIFLAFTPIMFRSGVFYLLALTKTISFYFVIIIAISVIFAPLPNRNAKA